MRVGTMISLMTFTKTSYRKGEIARDRTAVSGGRPTWCDGEKKIPRYDIG